MTEQKTSHAKAALLAYFAFHGIHHGGKKLVLRERDPKDLPSPQLKRKKFKRSKKRGW
jgi:uncharacterized damage-inducible protein DinB